MMHQRGQFLIPVTLEVRRFTNGAAKISPDTAQRNVKQWAVWVMRLATLRLSPDPSSIRVTSYKLM